MSKKPVLLDSASMLSMMSGAKKKKHGPGSEKKSKLDDILLQETGSVAGTKGSLGSKKTVPGKRKKSKSSTGATAKTSLFDAIKDIGGATSITNKQNYNANKKRGDSRDGAVTHTGSALERVRFQRNARNNVHSFASHLASMNAVDMSGDDVSYLEKSYERVRGIVEANGKKLQDGYTQLLGENVFGDPGTNTEGKNAPFNAEDALLLLMFAGIYEVDEVTSNQICDSSIIAAKPKPVKVIENKTTNTDGRGAADLYESAAKKFLQEEEGPSNAVEGEGEEKKEEKEEKEEGSPGIAETKTESTELVSAPATSKEDQQTQEYQEYQEFQEDQEDQGEVGSVNFEKWKLGVLGIVRHKLLAGILAERRGQLAADFMETAEQSSVMMHPMAPQREKPPDSLADNTGMGAPEDNTNYADKLADDLFGAATLTPEEQALNMNNGARSRSGGGLRRGSKASIAKQASQTMNNSMFGGGASLFEGSSIKGSNTGDLPALQLRKSKKVQREAQKKKIKQLGGFGDNYKRGTPRVLQQSSMTKTFDEGSVSSYTSMADSKLADIMALRRELEVTKAGMQELDTMVDTNIAWVHSNVDKTDLKATISDKTKERCRKLALEKLFDALQSHRDTTISWAIKRWAAATQYQTVSNMATVFSRAKSLEIMCQHFNEAIVRQYIKCWKPWFAFYRMKKDWEETAAATEIQRVGRGMLGKRKAYWVQCGKAAIIFQNLIRRTKARRRVENRRKYLRIHKAAIVIQKYFKNIVKMGHAREEAQRRRDLVIARRILQEQKQYQSHIQTEAEAKLRKQQQAKKKKANKGANKSSALSALKKKGGSQGRAPPKKNASRSPSPTKGQSTSDLLAQMENRAKTPPSDMFMGGSRPGSSEGAILGINTNLQSPSDGQISPSSHGGGSPYSYGQSRASPGGADLPLSAYHAPMSVDDALRMREEAEAYLQQHDPHFMPATTSPQLSPKHGTVGGDMASIAEGQRSLKSVASSPALVQQHGQHGTPTLAPSPSHSQSASAQGRKSPSNSSANGEQNSIDGEVPADAASAGENKGMFGGMFGGRKSTSPPPDNKTEGASPTNIQQQQAGGGGNDDEEEVLEEEEEYLSAEEVAEQDRLRAIEEEARIKREKEETYLATLAAKEREKEEQLNKKLAIAAEKDRIAFEQEEKERIKREEIEERQRIIDEAIAEEERLAEEERIRLEDEAEEERLRLEELEKLRETVANEERAKIRKAVEDELKQEMAVEMEKLKKDKEELEALRKATSRSKKGKGGGGGGGGDSPQRPQSASMFGGLASMFGGGSRPASATNSPKKGFGTADTVAHSTDAHTDAQKLDLNAIKEELAKGATDKDKGTPTKESTTPERPKSAFGGFLGSISNAFTSMKKKASSLGEPKKPVKVSNFKPFDPDDYDFMEEDLAIWKIQNLFMKTKARKLVNVRRENAIKNHKRVGELITWAVVLIQRTARGRQGLARFRWFKRKSEREFEALQNKSATLIQCMVRRKLAISRCKLLWLKRGEEAKAEEWKKYKQSSDRKAKLKVLAQGTPRKKKDESDESDGDPVTWGIDPEQVNDLDEKIRKLEAIEQSIKEREENMAASQKASEERAKALEDTLKRMEEKQKQEEAERAIQQDLLKSAMGSGGPMHTGRSMMASGGPRSARPGGPPPGMPPGSARGGPPGKHTGRGPPSARTPKESARHSAPPTARSAREAIAGDGIPAEAPRMQHDGKEWVQLWDPDEKATYWYCQETDFAQWDTPGTDGDAYSSGYDTEGGMTDYSTDYASGAETEYSDWQEEEWTEYWDDEAQASYFYNNHTGEATWTKPEGFGGETVPPSSHVPSQARQMPDEWVSYVDEHTGQEYWYNSRTGETSW